MYTDKNSLITWLTVQKQVLSVWLDELSQKPGDTDTNLIARLEEHERWLTRSIDELAADWAC